MLYPAVTLAISILLASSTAFAQSPAPTAESARAAARADRNREAAELFARAIDEAPAQRRELLLEWAEQLTYSQRPRQAIPLYEEVLREPRSAEEQRRARKGLGLAFLWTDQPGRAAPLFETLLREHPDDADASRNLGRALSWSNRQRAAIAHLRQHLARFPDDAEARVQLAQAQAWLGRPDVASRTLQDLQRDDARQLAANLARDAAPHTLLDAQRSRQSDQLLIRNWRAAQTVPIQSGRGMVGLRVDRTLYDREDGGDSARVTRPMVLGRYRFTDALEANFELGREHVDSLAGRDSDFTAYSTWLTFWPNDLLRIDASSSRSDFDNLRSLALGITHRDDGLSVDLTPGERLRATARWQRSAVSDGNRRRWSELEAEYRWLTHPDAWVGLRHTRFGYARQANNGYFDPLHFEVTSLILRTLWRPGGDASRWELAASAALGREDSVPYGGKNAYDASLRLRYEIDPKTRLEARAQRFSSRASTPSGFARTIFGLSLERSW